MASSHTWLTCLALMLATSSVLSQRRDVVSNIPYDDALPVIQAAIAAGKMPASLTGTPADALAKEWPSWVARRDEQIRERLIRGDEDSIVNLLLFGVTFTTQPRIAERDVFVSLAPRQQTVERRLNDFVREAASPGASERLLFVREVLRKQGIDPTTPAGQPESRKFLTTLLERYLGDVRDFVQASARREDVSTLFRDRGLSSDTSIHPGFAVEEALKALAAAGRVGAVQRVAVIGPGLDFADKREGLDFYPQQTIQPFAILDSLLRLRLASASDVRLTTFDLSPRVNFHLESALQRARAGGRYTVELPRSTDEQWHPQLLSYWRRFGDQIGDAVVPTPPPSLAGRVESRAVSVRPNITMLIAPRDLNVVLQRIEPSSAEEGFDLIVATNLLVYYDAFEQSLALTNIARMLKPGGWFLANDASVSLSSLEAVGYTQFSYSDKLNSRERLTWYQRR